MAQSKRTGEWIAFILGIVLVLLLIQTGNGLQGKRAIFPSADEVLRAFGEMLLQGKTYSQIGKTLLCVIQTVMLSVAAGVILGTAEALVPYMHALLRPVHALLRSMPMILLAMIMLMLTRFSQKLMPMLTGCLVLIPMVSEAAYEGIRRIDSDLIDVYRMDHGINPRIILNVYLPLTAGYIRQAFINACGMGLKVVVTAEYLVHTVGSVGQAVYSKLDSLQYAELFAYALIMVLLVLLLTGIPPAVIRIAGKRKKEEVTTG